MVDIPDSRHAGGGASLTKNASDAVQSDEDSPDPYYKNGQHDVECDWSPAEERKLVWKLDFIVLAILTICFFCMQMDRGNIGNAVTNNLFMDINIKQHQYNVGQQLLYLGIVLLELPSNIVLYRVGPRWWLSGQIVAWGLVEIFQYKMHSVGGFYATRMLLGLAEAGFIPAALYTLSMWYKRAETSKRFAIFYFGNLVSQGATSLLAYGIFHLEGQMGLHGWQWMFIIEGTITIFFGITLFLLLPNNPSDPYPISRISYFTARERVIMWKRVVVDDPSKEKKAKHVSMAELGRSLLNWKIYPHLLISMCGIATVSTWLSYAPKLVQQLNYGKLTSNAYVSIGGWLQIPISLALGIFSDMSKRRGLALFVGIIFVWGLVIGDYVVHDSMNEKLKFGVLITTLGFSSTWQPINASWLSINAATPSERSVTLAILVMFTNIGGIFGSQLFQPSDAPNYGTGWAAILGIWTVALVSTIVANVMYRWLNKKKSGRRVVGQETTGDERVKYWL